jgi:hypothetical protein
MKTIFNFFAIILTVFTVSSLAQNARAQYMYNYSSNLWVNSNMNLLFQKRWATARIRAAGKTALADALEGRRSNNSQSTTANPISLQTDENVLRRAPLSATSFKSNPATSMPFVFVAKFADENTEEIRTLIKASTELLKNYEQMLITNKETRLKNNVAGAATFALLMSRSIMTDGKNELSEKQAEAILQDINSLLASSDEFKNLPDIEKQKMYETFVITSGLATMLYQQGKDENSPEKAAQGKDLAKTILAQFFDRPLDEITFTDNGVQFN